MLRETHTVRIKPAPLSTRKSHGGRTHRAAASIPAGAGTTLINLCLTVGPRVPRPTRAGVTSLACVSAGGPVPAGLVVSAVVQVCGGQSQEKEEREAQGQTQRDHTFPVIKPGKPRAARRRWELTLVAEEAAPTLLAVALPGLLAGAVEAAWVPDALVTVPALPAHSAPRKRARVRWALASLTADSQETTFPRYQHIWLSNEAEHQNLLGSSQTHRRLRGSSFWE